MTETFPTQLNQASAHANLRKGGVTNQAKADPIGTNLHTAKFSEVITNLTKPNISTPDFMGGAMETGLRGYSKSQNIRFDSAGILRSSLEASEAHKGQARASKTLLNKPSETISTSSDTLNRGHKSAERQINPAQQSSALLKTGIVSTHPIESSSRSAAADEGAQKIMRVENSGKSPARLETSNAKNAKSQSTAPSAEQNNVSKSQLASLQKALAARLPAGQIQISLQFIEQGLKLLIRTPALKDGQAEEIRETAISLLKAYGHQDAKIAIIPDLPSQNSKTKGL